MATIKSVQEMLEDFGVAIGLKDPREEDHVDIRIEVLMPKVRGLICSWLTVDRTFATDMLSSGSIPI